MKLRHVAAFLRRSWTFTIHDIWDIEISSLTRLHAAGVKFLRIMHLVCRGFREDECPLHASALTFSTLMALVPILAFSLALARGFGGAETAKNKIRQFVTDWTDTFSAQVIHAGPQTNAPPAAPLTPPPTMTNTQALAAESDSTTTNPPPSRSSTLDAPPPTAIATVTPPGATPAPTNGITPVIEGQQLKSWLATQINDGLEAAFEKVDNVSFTALGGVGLVLLLWMIIQVLGHVEGSFNSVWGIATGRPVWRRFTDYLSMIVVLPILIIAAGSLPVVDFATRFFDPAHAAYVRAVLDSGALKELTVLAMTTVCFSFLIIFMPNTKVKTPPGFVGGFVTALLFLGWMKFCAAVQGGAVKAGRIYGSFAVVPILLAWVYVSWEIILFGAEVAFAMQNCTTYKMEEGARKANVRARILMALAAVTEAARTMMTGDSGHGFDLAAYARAEHVPLRFLNDTVGILVQAGFLAELADRPGTYALLKAPSTLTVQTVIDAIMNTGVDGDSLGLGTINSRIEKALERAVGGMASSLNRTTVCDLVGDVLGLEPPPARPAIAPAAPPPHTP